jgi:hypothetical protein
MALGILVAAICQAQTPVPRSTSNKIVLYASVGPDLTWYDVDIEHGTLVNRGAVALPANVQEAWPHPSKQYLYVAWSNGGPSYAGPFSGAASSGNKHGVSTFEIDKASGALHPRGQPTSLPSRPIHITGDVPGTHVLVAYNDPSGVTVHRIRPDGTVGSTIKQPAPLDVGIYAHQVRVDPSDKGVIVVTRGNGPAGTKPEDPGALKVFGTLLTACHQSRLHCTRREVSTFSRGISIFTRHGRGCSSRWNGRTSCRCTSESPTEVSAAHRCSRRTP